MGTFSMTILYLAQGCLAQGKSQSFLYHMSKWTELSPFCAQRVPSVTDGATAAQAGPDRVREARLGVGTGWNGARGGENGS